MPPVIPPGWITPSVISSVIYATKSTWISDDSSPSDIPTFPSGHYATDLLWYKHIGYENGSYSWEGARRVGTEWNFKEIFPGRSGKIYAIGHDDSLLWYNHLGKATGTLSWIGPRVVGSGWGISKINPPPQAFLGAFCDTRNGEFFITDQAAVIYAVRADGLLLWYRHDGGGDGTINWANGGAPVVVGNGWVE